MPNHAKLGVYDVAPSPIIEKTYRAIAGRKTYFFLALAAFAIFIVYTEQVKALLVLIVFGLASSTVTAYKRIVRLPPVFELISLTTVMVTIFYGPVVGVIYTVVVNLASEVFSGFPDVMTLTYIPSRTAQALFVYFAARLSSLSVAELGIWSVVVFNAIQQPMFMYLTDAEKRIKALYFVALNLPLNIILFRFFGQPLYDLLKAVL